jgi:vancomycin resistance protein VanW
MIKMKKQRKLFCEYGPICYKISLFKEAKKKDLRDFKNEKKFAKKRSVENLEYIWKGDTKLLLRQLHGVDMRIAKK